MNFVFDPTRDPKDDGWKPDGDEDAIGVEPGSELIIRDTSTEHRLAYFYDELGADIEGIEGRLRADQEELSVDSAGDTGVRIGLTVGDHGFSATLRRETPEDPRVCVVLAGGALSPGVSVEWAGPSPITVRLEAHPGDGLGRLIVTRADGTTGTEDVPIAELPEGRPKPSVDFGCFSELARAIARFTSLEAIGEAPAPTADLDVTNIELQPNAAERVKVEGSCQTPVDPASTDIQKIGLRCALAGGRFYPTSTDDFMPVDVRRDGEKWVITQAARDATGIQALELVHTGGGAFTFHLNDARTSLADLDYLEVKVDLALHLDDGTVVDGTKTVSLAKSGQTYRGPVS